MFSGSIMIKPRTALFGTLAFALFVAAAYAGPTAKEGVLAGTPSSIAAAEEILGDISPQTVAVAQHIARARAADPASHAFAAAQTTKQQCMNTCRARYRDCRHQNQLPLSECQGIYQDCTRYTCTGLGPG
jgi:hypothetical protein